MSKKIFPLAWVTSTAKMGLLVISISLTACGAAAESAADDATSDEAISASSKAWRRDAESAWTSNSSGYPSMTKIARDDLPKSAQRTFDRWAANGETPDAYSWSYKGRIGYFVTQLYNGSDSNITALFDARGTHLATCDSPNGETEWKNVDGSTYDPGTNGS
jgi:hypothetical protein